MIVVSRIVLRRYWREYDTCLNVPQAWPSSTNWLPVQEHWWQRPPGHLWPLWRSSTLQWLRLERLSTQQLLPGFFWVLLADTHPQWCDCSQRWVYLQYSPTRMYIYLCKHLFSTICFQLIDISLYLKKNDFNFDMKACFCEFLSKKRQIILIMTFCINAAVGEGQ